MKIIFITLLLFMPVFACILHFFYIRREHLSSWLAVIFVYYFMIFLFAHLNRSPVVRHIKSEKIGLGVTVYEFSNPKESCPWGGTYYTVIKTDSVPPLRSDKCRFCGRTYNEHGGQTSYLDEYSYNMSILLDYATSGNN